jgi:hypothetical protein
MNLSSVSSWSCSIPTTAPSSATPMRRPPGSVRIHVDVLLDLAWQLLAVRRDQAAEVTREHVEPFRIRVGERHHLGEEGVEPSVVGEP